MIRIPKAGDLLTLSRPLTGLSLDDNETEIPLPVGTRLRVEFRDMLAGRQGFQIACIPETEAGEQFAQMFFLDEGDRPDGLLEADWLPGHVEAMRAVLAATTPQEWQTALEGIRAALATLGGHRA